MIDWDSLDFESPIGSPTREPPSPIFPYTPLPEGDSYWRLDYPSSSIDHLHEQVGAKLGLRLPWYATRTELCQAFGRLKRQQLNYTRCSYEELCHFALKRKQVQKGDKEMSQEQLVHILEIADEERTFPLMKLPPELRCRIYDYYLATFPKTLEAPAHPPLAKTCKLVSTEILPMFYQNFEFRLTVESIKGTSFAFDLDTHRFFAGMPVNLASGLRNLSLIVNYTCDGLFFTTHDFEIKLKACEKGPRSTVSQKTLMVGGTFWLGPDGVSERMEKHLLESIGELANRGELKKKHLLEMPEQIAQAAFPVVEQAAE